jgi:hypothetical protein
MFLLLSLASNSGTFLQKNCIFMFNRTRKFLSKVGIPYKENALNTPKTLTQSLHFTCMPILSRTPRRS